ncbi:MAG: hypothetical protein HY650_07470, partial [Acidobacteria bacterium]|nr:hypothetical protein [Acidobacteriota bacterium]
MSSRPSSVLSLEEISLLPRWAARLVRKYYAGEASHFLLHGNIYDLVRSKGQYLGLLSFLQHEILGQKNVVLYNRSEGTTFGSTETERHFLAQQRVAEPLMSKEALKGLPREPGRALPLVERYLFYGEKVAVIINFLETIIPAGEINYLSGEDRNNLVLMQRWIT